MVAARICVDGRKATATAEAKKKSANAEIGAPKGLSYFVASGISRASVRSPPMVWKIWLRPVIG